MRCTNYTLNTFGIFPDRIILFGTGVIEELQNAGYKYKIIPKHEKTVRSFCRNHPKGMFYISTKGHAMALIDGKLFDHANQGMNLRRIIAVIKITK